MGSRCPIVVPYTTVRGAVNTSYMADSGFQVWKSRPITFHFIGKYDDRGAYALRRTVHEVVTNQLQKHSVVYVNTAWSTEVNGCDFDTCLAERRCICRTGKGKRNTILEKDIYQGSQVSIYHKTMQTSKFVLMLPGDTVTSSRLYDAFTTNTIPIIMSDSIMQYGLPFLTLVPWKDIAFFVQATNRSPKDIAASLERVATAPDYLVEHKLRMMQVHKQDVLWNIEGSRVTENIMKTMKQRCL